MKPWIWIIRKKQASMVIGQNNKSENNDKRHLNGEVCFEKNLPRLEPQWISLVKLSYLLCSPSSFQIQVKDLKMKKVDSCMSRYLAAICQ